MPFDSRNSGWSGAGVNPISAPAPPSETADVQSSQKSKAPAHPEWIGPYHILQKLGEGGLGEVYLAEQERPIRRKVALKIIKTGVHVPEVAARFRSEIRTVSLLDHPNITRALDAGTTEDGRPYCVMEYVPGIPITDYCDRNRLTIEQRLVLFAQICAAIHHAHQKAIIHRDIKASNVLVAVMDGQATPKVIDFGIVKAFQAPWSDRPLVTQHGELLGTPEYMSPEQAEMTALAVDTRTDIYSLGALLYELLVGALPFEPAILRQAGYGGIPRIIRESDLTPLPKRFQQLGDRAHDVAHRRRTTMRALRRRLRGELDWIVAKSMDKDPTRRYGSASEFAADIQRYLNHEPIVAAPGSTTYRLGKFIRRHNPVVIAAMIAVLAFLVGVFEITTGLIMQRKARIEAQQEVQRANAILEHLLRSVEAMDPATLDPTMPAQAVLNATAANLSDVFANKPDVEASAHSTLGRLYKVLGNREVAETHLRRALMLRKTVFGPEAPQTLESTGYLALLLIDHEQIEEADLLLNQALEVSRTKLGKNHSQTIAATVNLSRVREQQGRLDEAAELCRQALEAFQESGIRDHRQLATLRSEYGRRLMDLERYEEAESQLLDGLGDFKALLGENHAETRRAAKLLATLYTKWGMPEKAAKYQSSPQGDTPF